MSGYEEKRGEIYLADETKQRDRADAGTVLSCGYERLTGDAMEIKAGDRVLVEPYRGIFIKGAQFGEYRAEGWVRVYGLACGNWDEHHPTDWRQGILATIDENKVNATGRWLFVKKDRLQESKGGILLQERAQRQSGMGEIMSAGREASEWGYEAGQRIHFPPGLTFDSGLYEVSHAQEFGLGAEDYAFVDCRNVLGIVNG